MVTILPDFYKDFVCKADACRHSCCCGWEIDVDDATAVLYMTMEGKLGDELRQNIVDTDDTYTFKLTKDECCPFLQENGLCKIIIETGTDNLCNICTMHPRFFTYIGDVELGGVGLCCEKSCELLLAEQQPLSFVIEQTGQKLTFIKVLELAGIEIIKEALYFRPSDNDEYIVEIIQLMEKTEPIDENWTKRIIELRSNVNAVVKKLKSYKYSEPMLFERIYQYILYRHLESISDKDIAQVLNFANISTQYIYIEYTQTGDLAESVRRWAEQIEYCPENVDLILRAGLNRK